MIQKLTVLIIFSSDYVYVETAPVYPYQIRRIEELTKLGNGQIEAKVQCFYRRRDLSNPLIAQADRHAGKLGTRVLVIWVDVRKDIHVVCFHISIINTISN